MTKQDQFLWIAQTVILANVTNLSSVLEGRGKYSEERSPDGVFVAISEAVRASEMIPDNISAADASHDFCYYILGNLRDEEEIISGHGVQAPGWMQQHSQ